MNALVYLLLWGFAQQSGLINLLSDLVIKITNGSLVHFSDNCMVVRFSSAFVDNIPFTVTMIPVIDSLNDNSVIASVFNSFNISPLWWALSLGANSGGNGTLIGSSAAIIALGLAEKLRFGITFNRFIKVGFPFMILTVLVGTVVLLIDTLIRI